MKKGLGRGMNSLFPEEEIIKETPSVQSDMNLKLTQIEPMTLIALEDDGADEKMSEDEADLMALRGELIALVQDASRPLTARLGILLAAVDFAIPERDWVQVYRGLERLDPKWDACLDSIPAIGTAASAEERATTSSSSQTSSTGVTSAAADSCAETVGRGAD